MRTIRETSAGGVVYRRDPAGEIEVALAARRTRKGELVWGLAKGGLEEAEERADAAVREVREELGLDAEIEADLGTIRYTYVWEEVRVRKRVHFYLMRCTGGDVTEHDDEMEEVRWFPLPKAR
ncbi:MAG: NUDIX domain-containing protein, partial [Actinomycetota bacterium]